MRGSGIGALVCAARLARSHALRGRVKVAGPLPAEDRRLVNGCTLRARSLDYYAAALGTTRPVLLRELFGTRLEEAETLDQATGVVEEIADGGFRLRKTGVFMKRAETRVAFAYGLRNGHLAATLARRVTALGVPFTGEVPGSFEACRALAGGERPLVVNGSHLPVDDLPSPPKPTRFVAASQVPLRRRADASWPRHRSFLAARRRAGALDLGVFYPFVDALSPAADFYGIFYRIVPADPAFRKPDVLAPMRSTVVGVARALGFEPVDPEETRGEAVVPCLPWSDVEAIRPDWLDLHRTYSACTPIITGDGMSRAGLAGWIAAELLLAGEDPVPATNASLHGWRRSNRGLALAMTRLSRIAAALLRHAPAATLRPIGSAPDMWAGVGAADPAAGNGGSR